MPNPKIEAELEVSLEGTEKGSNQNNPVIILPVQEGLAKSNQE